MTFYLKKETFYGAWNVALTSLTRIKRYLRNDRDVKDVIKVRIYFMIRTFYYKNIIPFQSTLRIHSVSAKVRFL